MIRRLQGTDGPVDLQPLFFDLTLETSTLFLFGEGHSTTNSGFATALEIAQEWVFNRIRIPGLAWIYNSSTARQACRDAQQYVSSAIDACQLQHHGQAAPLLLLLEKTTPRPALDFQALSVLTAARDTTACLLSWAM